MNGNYLLDTNILIALLSRDPALRWVLRHNIRYFVPSISVGELFYGAYNSSRISANLQTISELLARLPVVQCGAETADYYGQIKTALRKRGKPIPQNDIWIAALARENQLTLLTRDEHFRWIEGLQTDSW